MILVPIDEILFDKGMLNTLRDLQRTTDTLRKLVPNSGFRLGRLKMYLETKTGAVNTPVKVKYTRNGYKVMDGRHRVVYSLLRNYKVVPAQMVRN